MIGMMPSRCTSGLSAGAVRAVCWVNRDGGGVLNEAAKESIGTLIMGGRKLFHLQRRREILVPSALDSGQVRRHCGHQTDRSHASSEVPSP
jgi:hypothetical protein